MSESELESESFEDTSGCSATHPMICSALRKNGFVMLKGRPCEIIEVNTLPSGGDGQTNVKLVGLDIFTNKKYEDTCPSTHNIDVPNVNRSDFQLIDISDDGFVKLMNEKGDARDDLRLPDGELATKIRDEFRTADYTVVVTVLSAVGGEAIIACKKGN